MAGVLGPGAATAAYRATQSLGQALGGEAAATGSSFGTMLEAVARGAVQSGQQADAASAAALTGQGGVGEVVLAVSRAELALQTAVAVRDRVVAAYQDIMRMPI
jgi:flagellar hook-basal body complex protein FliE